MSFAAVTALRRAAAVRAPQWRTFASKPIGRAGVGGGKTADQLSFREAWLSDPTTYPIMVVILSARRRPAKPIVKTDFGAPERGENEARRRGKRETTTIKARPSGRPCRWGAVVSWERRTAADVPRAKTASSRARLRSPRCGDGRATFLSAQPRARAAPRTARSASSRRRTCGSRRPRGRRSSATGRSRLPLVIDPVSFPRRRGARMGVRELLVGR